MNDICMAKLMGLNVENIPLLMAAKSFMPDRKVSILLNGFPTELNELEKFATIATLPPGWINK